MTAKILILDDEASACQVIDNFLVAEGYDLRFVANGVEGLEQARAWQPDVILCDVMMPVMDGFAFCRNIRADASLEQVPIILVTALNDRQSKLTGLQAGADDFISKPVDAYELRARLRTITRLDRFRKLNDERARLEAESVRRRILFDESPDGILIIDPQTARFIEFNTAAHTQLGYTREEFASLHIFDVEARETTEETRTHIGDVLHHGRSDFETMQRTKQGELRHVHVTAQIVEILGQPAYYCTWRDVTERKRAEEALRRNEQILRLFVEHSPAAIAMFDREMRYIVTSRRYMTDFRLGDQDVTGRTHYAVFPEMTERQKEIHRRCLAGAVEKNDGAPFLRADGTLDWVRWEIHPWYEADGAIGGLIFFSEVITERKLAEKELRESEEKYRSLLASLESVVVSVDEDGRLLYLNDMAARHLGAPAEALVGKSIQELFSEPVATSRLEHIRQVIREDRPIVNEGLSPVQGQPRWHRTAIQPVHDQTGQVAYALINSTDIHNLKMAEDALRQQLDVERVTAEATIEKRDLQLRTLFNVMPDLIIRFRRDGSILDYNFPSNLKQEDLPAFLLTSQLEVSDYPEVAKDFAPWLEQAFATPHMLHTHHLCLAAGDSPQVFEARLVAGNAEEAICVLRDITESERAGETLRRANAELERAIRMKDEFLANMSHELRTPLNAILMLSEILLEQVRGPLNEHQERFIQSIESSGRHLLDLINDLLDISKIEAGKLELQLEPVEVNEMCQASLLFVRELALKRNILLEYANPTPDIHLTADAKRLKQMLVNLLSNAVKFTPDGGHVQLTVTVKPTDRRIEFAVQDTGIGISADEIARLFQPFTQLDSTLARHYEGTGLGLALVKRLANQHGGHVRAESAGVPGLGSCFTITLPFTPAPTAEGHPADAAPSAPIPVAGETTPRDYTVLVVEDNEVNINVLTEYLEYYGYAYRVARTGPQALALALAGPPDVILMDIQLPEIDGLAVTRRLRADPRLAATPIIAVTALAMPGDRERCLAAGATDYLIKPLNLNSLRRMLTRLIAPPTT